MSSNSKIKIAVFVSGRGSNLLSLLNKCNESNFPARIGCVVSSSSDATGLGFSEQFKVPSAVFIRKDYSTRVMFEDAIDSFLIASGIEFICLAGFMHILGPVFLSRWNGKIINIHPSLLPYFKGLNAQKQALESGMKVAGCTVHHVNTEVDSGEIILQGVVPIMHDDTVESLSERIVNIEHICYPKALEVILKKKDCSLCDKHQQLLSY